MPFWLRHLLKLRQRHRTSSAGRWRDAGQPLETKPAAEALVKRVLKERAGGFSVAAIAGEDGKDVFEIESVGGKVMLRGNNAVSIASALNHYLKNFANCHLSWCGDQMDLPAELPVVPEKVRITTLHEFRVMFNYCTFNYTCSWWDWERWERELDFLAMNGINTPLGVIGLETVWYNTLIKEGFTDEEAREYLVGPSHFAWQWMTNIQSVGGPIPKHWLEERVKVGQKWVLRARELGMTPIQQGFSGCVPRSLKEKRPEAAIVSMKNWFGMAGSSQLDPTDPYFKKFGRTFLEESLRLYGTSHLWAADPFHEGHPPKPGKAYLAEVGKSIHQLMKDVDPKAVWMMQSWSIRKDIATAVPKGDLIVLDLAGAKDPFWGHKFVSGRLHNFGGRINLHGDIRNATANPFAAKAKRPGCVGMGLFPEAIVQNPVFYEACFDMVWRDKGANAEEWLKSYATRRYGKQSDTIDAAWKILLNEGPYKPGTNGVEFSSMVAARPALAAKKSGPNAGFKIPYPTARLADAVKMMLSESERFKDAAPYRYDVVDFTRQVLSNHLQKLHAEIRDAYTSKDKARFVETTARFHEVLRDLDTLLASREEFLFGKWLADARSFGATPEESEQYARNATQLVTIWGPETDRAKDGSLIKDEQIAIFDYSWREWSGLISRYYLPRWEKFHSHLLESIDKGDYRDPNSQVLGRESFRANPFYDQLADWELAFVANPPKDLPAKPKGDSVELAKRFLEKYITGDSRS